MPHHDTMVLTLEIGRHLIKRILVDLGSAADLLYLLWLLHLGYKPDNLRNPGIRFNGAQTHSLGEIVLPISTGPIIALVLLTTIDEPSSFTTILGHLDPCDEGIFVLVPPNAKFLESTGPN